MGSENWSSVSVFDEFEEIGAQKISVNGSDSFVVDIERFAADKDENASSRITLQRNLSRKGSQQQQQRGATNNETLAISPRGSLLQGGGTPEKPTMVVVVGATDHHSHGPQVHNPITIVTGAAKSKGGATTIAREFSFKRSNSASSWLFDPRKILFFFATISSIGTIILICCTLSMNKLNGDEIGLN